MAGHDDDLEFDEDALFGQDDDGQAGAASAMSSDDEDGAAAPASGAGAASGQRPAAGLDSSSSSDDGGIEEELVAAAAERRSHSSAGGSYSGAPSQPSPSLGATVGPSPARSSPSLVVPSYAESPARPRRPVSHIPAPQSRKKLAMDAAAAKLGTSVPIAIPMGPWGEEREPTPESPDEPGGIHAATFVPPHMLELRSGALHVLNSVQGTSPAASMKRERLQSRNAILRSTGFLEESRSLATNFHETMDPICEMSIKSSDAPPRRPQPIPHQPLELQLPETPPASFTAPGALARELGASFTEAGAVGTP